MPNDLHHRNLRGRSFKGQDLTDANFSYADIRGSDFTQAVLVGANFSYTRTGLTKGWLIAKASILLIVAILAGFISAYAGASVGGILVLENQPLGALLFVAIFTLILFFGFILITIFRGIGTTLWLFAVIVVTCVAMLLAFPGKDYARASAILLAIVITVNIAGVLLGAIAIAVARVLSTTWMLVLIELVTFAAAVLGIIAGCEEIIGTPAFVIALAIAIPVTLALVSLSLYIGWRAIAGDLKYTLIRNIAIILCSYGGTSFRGADLTDADFSYATLKNADFRKANLTRTCWFRVQKIHQSRIERTYLEYPQIRQLVITKNGQEHNFDRLDLRGLNLQGANLINASLIGVKLSEANLSNANLSRAKLVQSQLYNTDLTGACLTGAIIEDWGISTDTKLEGVKCDYIYMRLPTPSDLDPLRKPDKQDEIFKEGDFADFIAPIIKTLTLYKLQDVDTRAITLLDLYHYEGIDPSAAAIALKQLAEQYPEAGLEVVALEGRGNEKIRLQAKVTAIADRSALSTEYSAKYEELMSLPYQDLQSLLAGMAEKDERIRSLETMVMTAIKTNKFYVETYYDLGDTVTEDRSININSGGGNVSGIVGGDLQDIGGVLNLGTISGDVSNVIGQLPKSSEAGKPGLKELLTQLQTAVEAEPELSDEDKAEALEQVKTLAEAGHNLKDKTLQKAAKTAIKILKGTVASLPIDADLAKECTNLLPAISAYIELGSDAAVKTAITSTTEVRTILILTANPKTTSPLRLDEEVREIDAGLQRAKKREQFDLKQRWAVRVRDVYQTLLDFKPRIIHFSGHGTGDDGLVLEDETGAVNLVDTEALAGLFQLFNNQIECVLLNACYSEVQATAIVKYIPYVIGMSKAIGDKAAIEFAVGFYSALGAGESIEFAYQLGCSAIRLAGIPEHLTPILKKKQ